VTHLGYILAAYLATAVVLAALVIWVALDLRVQKSKLRRLEDEGLRKRQETAR
jgi:heme exporter protein D